MSGLRRDHVVCTKCGHNPPDHRGPKDRCGRMVCDGWYMPEDVECPNPDGPCGCRPCAKSGCTYLGSETVDIEGRELCRFHANFPDEDRHYG